MLGFVGAVIWLVIHYQRRQRFAALPALWLSGTMLLFQNLTAHFFFYPARPGYINMHYTFWVMFILMVLYAIFARPRAVEIAERAGPETERPFPWVPCILGTIAALAIAVFLTGYINNERTMGTANTRWPIWEWKSGPFPGGAARR
jgi:hypothetical protein